MFTALAVCVFLIAFSGFQHSRRNIEYMKPYEILDMIQTNNKEQWSVYVSGYIMALWHLAVVFGIMALTQGALTAH